MGEMIEIIHHVDIDDRYLDSDVGDTTSEDIDDEFYDEVYVPANIQEEEEGNFDEETAQIVSDYITTVYRYMPKLIESLHLNNVYGSYMAEIEEINRIDRPSPYVFQTLDFLSIIDICSDVLASIDPQAKNLVIDKIADGTLIVGSQPKTRSQIGIVDGQPVAIIGRLYNIFDIASIIHELFHLIHLEHFDNRPTDDTWYTTTEAIAMTGSMYTFMYMYKHNILKEDAKQALKLYFWKIMSICNNALLNGVILETFDTFQTISDETMESLIKNYDYSPLCSYILHDSNFEMEILYHDKATYNLGFPAAFMLAIKMIDDPTYCDIFRREFSVIECHTPKSFLTNFGLEGLIDDPDFICQAMNYISMVLGDLYTNDEIKIKPYMIEMM